MTTNSEQSNILRFAAAPAVKGIHYDYTLYDVPVDRYPGDRKVVYTKYIEDVFPCTDSFEEAWSFLDDVLDMSCHCGTLSSHNVSTSSIVKAIKAYSKEEFLEHLFKESAAKGKLEIYDDNSWSLTVIKVQETSEGAEPCV